MTETGAIASTPFGSIGDIGRWQVALDAYKNTFSCLAHGSRIGLVAEAALSDAGRVGSSMLVWQATDNGLRVLAGKFPGFEQVDVDILMIADEAALSSLTDSLEDDVLATVRQLIREGKILFFARKAMPDLDNAGYEDLLDQLGFAFMGACR